MINYDELVKVIEKFLGIDRVVYSKDYNSAYDIVKNSFINRGYEFGENKLIIDSSDISYATTKNELSKVLAELVTDENAERVSLSTTNYIGVNKDGLIETLDALSMIGTQNSTTENQSKIKSLFPLREHKAVKLILFAIVFYDLGLYDLSAIVAAILTVGNLNDYGN